MHFRKRRKEALFQAVVELKMLIGGQVEEFYKICQRCPN